MISLLLCLCMVFSLLPTVVLADGESVESNQPSGEVCPGVTWEYDTESKTLTVSGTGLITLEDLTGNTHPWDAFKTEIEHLVIDKGITGTGSIKVFAELSALQTVQFPDSLTTLATGTFATDTALSSVVLPESIESIGDVVFSMCTGLTSLTILNRTMKVSAEKHWSSNNRKAPDGLTVYGYRWKSDDNQTDDNLTDFYRYVQWQNDNNGGSIQFVALDNTEDAKGGLIKNAEGSDSQIYWAFNDATNTLTVSGTGDINWDGSPECYDGGENPPWNKYKSQIENLVIDEGITGTSQIKIFAGLANLKNIQFPSTFKKLADGTFATCTNLASVTLPEQLVSMGNVVFSNCLNLKMLVVENRELKTPVSGNWSTGSNTSNDQPVNKLPNDLTVYGYRYTDDSKETETTLYQYVQWQNTGRPKDDTQRINFVAFDDDTSASSGLIVGSNNILWVFDENTKTLTVSGEGNITWDAKLYKAGDNPPWAAFISQIEKLVIDEGITGSSETKLFANLTCLQQISFPSTFTSLGDGTFATASALENVVIPATVTKMGTVVFSACDNLKTLTVLNRTMQITDVESDWTTVHRPAPQNLTVYGYRWKSDDKNDENLTDIYKYVRYNNERGGKITFIAQDESDWTPIDETGISWRYDAATKTLYLMGSGEIQLDIIKYDKGDTPPWQAHKKDIEKLVIGEGITGTGTLKIFSSLENLKDVRFPSTFKKLEQGTFATCTSLERIVLPDAINFMSGSVFSRCNAMTSLVVKNRNLYVPVETPWSSDETIPQNLTVYGYQYTNDTGATETKLYQYVKYQNDHYSGTINFVALDDPNPTAGQIGNSDTYWRYDPETTTLFITGKGMIPGGSSGNYPWQAYADEITNLVIGDGVTGTEATKALAELNKLRSITFGKDFAILGAAAFANIQTLTRLTLPETITTFGSFPFSGCYGMTELRVECRNIRVANVNSYWNAAAGQPLPEHLTVYGYRYTAKGSDEETAFYQYITNEKNKGITFVDLDAEADLLGGIRWNYDSSAKKLTISGKGAVPAVREGVAWNRYASEIEEIEIEKGVTSIEAGAFTGMPKLKTVTINRTVTNIAADAFDKPYSFMIKAKRNSAAKTFAKDNDIKFEEIVTANILFIGNSYTEDAREYLRYVFNQYDFPADIHFGHLFSGGKTLAYYANTARQETNNSDVYGNGVLDTESPRAWESSEGGNTYTNSLTYYTWDNHQTTFASQGTKRIADAMNDQDWDIVIIQGHDIEQAYGDEYNKYNKNFATNLEYLTNYIKSFDSTVEIGWYMTWRRNSKEEGFARLQAYWETMKNIVETNENVSFIVPIGTAVENARGTYIDRFNYRPESQNNIAKVDLLTGDPISGKMTPDNNEGIQRDNTHMSAVVGRFLAGYTMGEMLVNHINGLGGAQFTDKEPSEPIEQIYSYDPNIGLLPAEYVQTIKACAEAAMENPYEVTPLKDHETDPVQTVKTQVESADFTNTEWNETAIQAKVDEVLAQKPGAKVTDVSISGNTATVTLRYGYSTIDAHCEKNIEPPLQVSITAVGNAKPLFLGDTVTVTTSTNPQGAEIQVACSSDALEQVGDATPNEDGSLSYTFKVRKITAAFVNATFTANAKTDADVTASAQTTLGMNLRNRIHLKLKDADNTAITDATVKLQSNYDASKQTLMSYDDNQEYRNADWEVSNVDYGTIVVTLDDGRMVTLKADRNGDDILTKLQEGTEEIYCEYTFPAYKVTGKLFFNGEPVLYDGSNQMTSTVSGNYGTDIPYTKLENWAKEYVLNTLDVANGPAKADVEIKKDGGTVALDEIKFGDAGKLQNYVYVNVKTYYTVTFMNGETQVAQEEVLYGTATPVPAENPTREGYKFLGWAEVVGDELRPVTDKVTRTVTYQAQWKNVRYTVAYHGNGGVLASNSDEDKTTTTATIGQELTLKNASTFVRAHYDFVGWATNPDATVADYAGSQKFEVGYPNAVAGETYDLYAVWTKHVYTVSINACLGGNQLGWITNMNVTVGDDLLDAANAELDRLHSFQNKSMLAIWEEGREDIRGYHADRTKIYSSKALAEFENPVFDGETTQVYINYLPNTDTPYNVEHYQEKLDGTYELFDTDSLNGTTGTIVEAVAKSCHHFTADKTVDGTVASGTIAGDGSLVLKLYYTRNTYSYEVRHIKQLPDGTYDEANAEVENLSGKFEAIATVNAKDYGEHYPTNNAGTKQNIKIEKDLTIDVLYDLDEHTLTFDAKGGTETDSIIVRHGNTVAKPEDPKRSGYRFNGWFDDERCREKHDFDAPLVEDATVYAGWTKRSSGSGVQIESPNKPKQDNSLKFNTEDHFAYVNGYPDGTVKPTGDVTRAEVAAILYRVMDADCVKTYETTRCSFSDVVRGDWFNLYVATLENAGVIVDTRTNGKFRPNEAITRAELAAMLAQFADIKSAANSFNDVSARHWASDEIAVCAKMGWINGYPDGSFRPDATITRAEMMAMINRALGRTPKSADDLLSGMKTWRDNANVNAWYYLDVQEATNSHTYTKSGTHETWKKLR